MFLIASGFENNKKNLNKLIEVKSQNDIMPNDALLLLTKMLGEVKDKNLIDEIQEAINFHKHFQSLLIPQFDVIRKKRQVTSVNCSALYDQLAKIDAQVLVVQQNITDANTSLNTLNQKVSQYQIKVNTTTGSSQALNVNLLKSYMSLANSTSIRINQLKDQLAMLQAQEIQTKSDIQTYCTTTTSTST